MNTITIYRITCTRAYMMGEQGTGYSLRPWSGNTEYYEGYDDGGQDYILPAGYHAAMSQGMTEDIYDPRGKHCTIHKHRSGRPQLVSSAATAPVLNLARQPA